MRIHPKLLTAIAIIFIVVIVVAIIVILTAEADRKKSRKVLVTKKMYYENGRFITAPFNYLVHKTVRRQSDLDAMVNLDDGFPQHNQLEQHWKHMQKEVLELYRKGEMKKIKNDVFFQNIADDKWKRFYIKWYSPSLDEAKEKLPFTTKLIDSIPSIRSAMISVLEPGSRIVPHAGPYGGVFRYHLALKVPQDRENCWIRVDGEKYHWTEGRGVLFDDTYVHEVQNNTDELRIVLFCDVQRDLNHPLANALIELSSMIAKITTRNNK